MSWLSEWICWFMLGSPASIQWTWGHFITPPNCSHGNNRSGNHVWSCFYNLSCLSVLDQMLDVYYRKIIATLSNMWKWFEDSLAFWGSWLNITLNCLQRANFFAVYLQLSQDSYPGKENWILIICLKLALIMETALFSLKEDLHYHSKVWGQKWQKCYKIVGSTCYIKYLKS